MRLKRNITSLIKFIIVLFIFSLFLLFLYDFITNDQKRWAQSKINKQNHPNIPFLKKNLILQPFEKIDWHNYKQIVSDLERRGAGEQGTGVLLPASDSKLRQEIFMKNGFNGLASDRMALNRSVKDIRHVQCRSQLYQAQLPSVSIVIPFYEEHWSTLLRTFISSINRAPEGIIKEVILVDDASTKEFLKGDLDKYLANNHNGMVRVLRNQKREGLIRTRLTGAKNATGDVLIFLDSHCEANINWLPPLLDPIARDYRTVVCPFIDVLDAETFEYRAQDEGARGAFDWEFYYKRLPLLPEDLLEPAKPFKSPVMAGGLFAISRKWFWELGGYDPGLDIWGGEQYELSFKIWQCGGQMVDAPCSRIGHVYRKYAPFPAVVSLGNFIARNYRRVAEVWMDEYKDFLYKRQPSWGRENPGDISAQFAIRERLKCKSFKWFMTEVAFDLEKVYPSVEPDSSSDGEVRSSIRDGDGRALCLDARAVKTEAKVRLAPCVKDDRQLAGEQKFMLSWREDIRLKSRSECLDVPNNTEKAAVILYTCHGQKGNQLWKYLLATAQLYHVMTNKCLTADGPTKEVYMDTCSHDNNSNSKQKWLLENLKEDVVKRYNQNLVIS